MKEKSLELIIPATVANLGPGFDVLGASVNLYNEFTFTPGKKFTIVVLNNPEIPADKANLVWKSFSFAWKKFSGKYPEDDWQITINDRIPLGSGLGSSATANLAGVVAAATFLGIKDEKKILTTAVKIEGHPDNIVPAYFGGLCAAYWDGKNLSYSCLKSRVDLPLILWWPERKVLTENARKVLPESYLQQDVVFNLSRMAFLLTAIKDKNFAILKLALDDKIHQPYRKKFIPEFDIIKKIARRCGAYGVVISGSGPSLAVIVSPARLRQVEKSIRKKISYGKLFQLKFEQKGIRKKWL